MRNFFDIDPYKECSILNELFEQHNIPYYGFDPFFLPAVRSVKNSYDSALHQTGRKKNEKYNSIRNI